MSYCTSHRPSMHATLKVSRDPRRPHMTISICITANWYRRHVGQSQDRAVTMCHSCQSAPNIDQEKEVHIKKCCRGHDPWYAVVTTPRQCSTPSGTAAQHVGQAVSDFEHEEQLMVLPCPHEFHVDCIEPWLLKKSSQCPMCKRDCLPRDEKKKGR